MTKIKIARWNLYVIAFLLLWSGLVALDLAWITPMPIVRHIIAHRSPEAAIIAISLFVMSFAYKPGTE
jgi:hypothetical protein